jgi:hypothetical protein
MNSMQLLEENNNLRSQCTDHQNDIESLRKDILQAEQNRLDLESEKITLQEKIKYCEMEKEKVICALHLPSMWLNICLRSTLSCLKWPGIAQSWRNKFLFLHGKKRN